MSGSKKSNDSVDHFSEYFRQRLKMHSTQPDDDCWNGIKARLPQKRQFNLIWFGVAIAASLIIAVFMLQPNKESTLKIRDKVADVKMLSIEKNESVNPVVNNLMAEISASNITRKQPILLAEDNNPDQIKPDEVLDQQAVLVDIQKEDNQEEDINKIDSSRKIIFNEPYMNDNQIICQSSHNQKLRQNGWQISAGFSSGNSFGSFWAYTDNSDYKNYHDMQNSFPVFESNNGLGLEEDNQNTNIDDIKNINHSLPVSFGVTVRKKMNNTWSIESGLLYTYLSSDFEIVNNYHYDATLKLHYLGVPVNLIANIWNNEHWNVYLSGGVMVEKGLRSVYKQNKYSQNSIVQSKQEKNISGLQWSLNGALGISYNLYKDIDLYTEPGISYFFDCNQPLSKRTEDPTNFNIRVGIRYNLK